MTAERATGVILRTRPLTETSLIVGWLTAGCGRVATVAKGARRPKSPFRGKLDLFYVADFSFHRSRRGELHTLREAVPRQLHPALREDFPRLRQAAYCALLVEQTTETDTPLPGLCALFLSLLERLDHQPAAPALVLAFEAKLLEALGLAPAWDQTPLSPGARQILARLGTVDFPGLATLVPSAPQSEEIARFLQGFLLQHLGRVPRGRAQALGL